MSFQESHSKTEKCGMCSDLYLWKTRGAVSRRQRAFRLYPAPMWKRKVGNDLRNQSAPVRSSRVAQRGVLSEKKCPGCTEPTQPWQENFRDPRGSESGTRTESSGVFKEDMNSVPTYSHHIWLHKRIFRLFSCHWNQLGQIPQLLTVPKVYFHLGLKYVILENIVIQDSFKRFTFLND